MFVVESGETHLLSRVAGYILELLEIGSRSRDELHSAILAEVGSEGHDAVVNTIDDTLSALRKIGLVWLVEAKS